tara:strand:- start:99 stop:611 length:513 start_codon:yes stop_codon:yes gene_type:complete
MIIYSDMDGVLADFFGDLEKLHKVNHWKEIRDIDKALQDLKGTQFFADLPTFHMMTYPLVGHLKEIESLNKTIQWGIISTPLKCDHEHSIEMKKRWLKKNGLMPSKHNLHFLYDKEQLATNRLDGSPNVLIDDKITNIKKWKDAGGIGLQFQANKDSVVVLMKRINGVIR